MAQDLFFNPGAPKASLGWQGGPTRHWATPDPELTHSDSAPATGDAREVRGGRRRPEVCGQEFPRREDKAVRRQGKNVGAGEESGWGIRVVVALGESGRAPLTPRHPTGKTCSSDRCVRRLRRRRPRTRPPSPGRPGENASGGQRRKPHHWPSSHHPAKGLRLTQTLNMAGPEVRGVEAPGNCSEAGA